MTSSRRLAIAALVAAAAGIHAAAAAGHASESALHGAFFVTLAVAQAAAATAIATRGGTGTLRGIAAAGVAVPLLWLVSRTAGLPGSAPEPVGSADLAATAAQLASAALAAVSLARLTRATAPARPRPAWLPRLAAAPLAVAVATSAASAGAAGHAHQASAPKAHAGSHTHVGGGHIASPAYSTPAVDGVHLHGISRTTTVRLGRPAGVAVPVGDQPVALAEGLGFVWSANRGDGSITRVDPVSLRTRTVDVATRPSAIATGLGSVWVADYRSDEVMRVNPRSLVVEGTVPVGAGPLALAVTSEGVWVANSAEQTVSLVDPQTMHVSATIPVGFGPSSLVAADRSIWVVNSLDRTVQRIDAHTRIADPAAEPAGAGASGALVDDGRLLVANASAGSITSVHLASGRRAETVVEQAASPGLGPVALARAGDTVWVANSKTKTVQTLDGDARPVAFGAEPRGYPIPLQLIEAGGALWVNDFDSGTIVKLDLSTLVGA